MSAIFDITNPTGWLEVEGVSLRTPAWGIFEDLTGMLAPSAWRDGNLVVPHQPGRVPMPVMVDEATWKFRFPVAGDVDQTGARYDDPVVGFMSNLATLRGVLDVPALGDRPDSTREVTYHLPGGGTAAADCHLFLDQTARLLVGSDTIHGYRGALKKCVLTVRCPAGLFEVS